MRKTEYAVKPARPFKTDYKSAIRRGLTTNLLEDVIVALATGNHFPKRIKTMPLPGIGVATVSAVSSRTGYWFTALRTTCWY